ncbi:hypothetical protein HanXRQr2_Chr09g0369141 [Helianthus annuus]|uniref:Uncharacterized protein n=1 Tax=Helianthus annuus TaxID=4232 RepID=A0A251TTG5_HELAN|nr:hypothetical protein HanXRQr2_Chr09g0369141 [Helianthus annuus]
MPIIITNIFYLYPPAICTAFSTSSRCTSSNKPIRRKGFFGGLIVWPCPRHITSITC